VIKYEGQVQFSPMCVKCGYPPVYAVLIKPTWTSDHMVSTIPEIVSGCCTADIVIKQHGLEFGEETL
jgi:hypothetical protein